MVEGYFPATYSDGRARFLSACLDAGVPVASYRNPNSGPQGEALFADAALVGPADAENVVVVTSSTHGVEDSPDRGSRSAFCATRARHGRRPAPRCCSSTPSIPGAWRGCAGKTRTTST